jgi:hypothetical protein
MKVNYYINGVHFDTYGVKVSASRGLLNSLKMREPVKVTWPDHHGEVMDLATPRYESREITLECYIKAATSTAFILAVQSFLAAFQATGLQRLMIDVNDGEETRKALVYEIYLGDEAEISKKWNATLMIGTFNLKLREPEPVKRVYKFVAATGAMTVTMTITTPDPVNIYWGDGAHVYDIITSSGQQSHIYTAEGTFYIVITGVIENITGVTTTATLVWTRL